MYCAKCGKQIVFVNIVALRRKLLKIKIWEHRIYILKRNSKIRIPKFMEEKRFLQEMEILF